MKNLKTTISILTISLIAIFTSCKKTSTTNSAASSGGSVTATIGSVSFNAASANISKVSNIVTVQGAQADGSSIQIQVSGLGSQYVPTAATYNLDPNAGNNGNYVGTAVYMASVVGTTAGKTYASGGCDASLPRSGFVPNGSVTFTEISSTKIAGTFKFNAAQLNDCGDVKVISTGSFSKTF